MSTKGRCLCGATTFAYEGNEIWCTHCHCESCRRQTSSPFTTFVAIPRRRFEWLSGTPASFTSSPGVIRSFCAICGTPMAYENENHPDEIHLYLASLNHPRASLRPTSHDFWNERVDWINLVDDLPKPDPG